jgi:hypothetical protein
MDIITTKGKEGVKLQEYKGVYSLISCYNNYAQWGKIKVSKEEYSEKDRPVKVTLGDKETAIKTLEHVIHYLRGAAPAKEDEVPF